MSDRQRSIRLHLLVDVVSGSGFPDRFQGRTGEELPFYKVSSLSGAVSGELSAAENSISRELAEHLKARVIPVGSVVMAKIGAAMLLGRFARTTTPCCIDNNMQALVPKADMADSRFLAYVMTQVPLHALVKDGPVPTIDVVGMKMTQVPKHDVSTQRLIADFLDRETCEIDAMVDKMNELTDVLEERRDSVVMKGIERHFDGPTVPLAFASDPKNFFDGDWVESKDQDPDGEIRLLQLADVGAGKFLDKSNRRVNQEAFDRLACREVLPGDVLIARMPDPLGRACVLPAGLGRTITVVDVAVVRTDPTKMIPAYLAYVLNSRRFRALIESLQGGSTRQRISRSRLGQQRIPAVSLDVQQATADQLDEATARIEAMLAKVADLKSLLLERRAALITDVVTGKKEIE